MMHTAEEILSPTCATERKFPVFAESMVQSSTFKIGEPIGMISRPHNRQNYLDATVYSALDRIPLLDNLGKEGMRFIHEQLRTHSVRPATNIIDINQFNDRIFLLLSGTVRIFLKRNEHAEAVLGILGVGETIGEISALDGLPASASVKAIEACRLVSMQATEFVRAMERYPRLALNLTQMQNRRMRRLTSHWEALANMSTDARLARHLLVFAQDYGISDQKRLISEKKPSANFGSPQRVRHSIDRDFQRHPASSKQGIFTNLETKSVGILIPLRLTQSDLAALCGASVRQINRLILAYKQEGLIALEPGYRIKVLDRESLAFRFS